MPVKYKEKSFKSCERLCSEKGVVGKMTTPWVIHLTTWWPSENGTYQEMDSLHLGLAYGPRELYRKAAIISLLQTDPHLLSTSIPRCSVFGEHSKDQLSLSAVNRERSYNECFLLLHR